MATEQDVNMELPDGESEPSPMKIAALSINVDKAGIISVGAGESNEILDSDLSDRNVPLLSQRLEPYKMGCDLAGEQPVVKLNIHGDATQQRMLDCMNVLAKHNIKSVTFTDLVD